MSNGSISVEVSEFLTTVNPRNWDYVEIADPVIWDKFENVRTTYAECTNRIGRQIIKNIYRRDIGEGVIATIMWGYPKGRYPGGRGFNGVFSQVANIVSIVEDAQERKSEITADELCYRLSRIAGIGVSTYSKILYLAEIAVKEGICLIYDQMVMRAISRSRDPELIALSEKLGSCFRKDKDGKDRYWNYPGAIQEATYGQFLTAVGRIALRDGLHPADVEQALFFEAPSGRLAA